VNSALAEELLGRRLIVCAGGGGVGKTTLSAALALFLARRGRRVLVVTIDPARRLAEALGVAPEGNRIVEATRTSAGGVLEAMMLDCRLTFDESLARHARSKEEFERVRTSHLYEHVATALSRTHEYMALEKLHELHHDGTYDHIVLDTPPTRDALGFLDAPQRMLDFCNERIFRWFVPEDEGSRLLRFGRERALWLLGRVVDQGNLGPIAEFLGALAGLFGGFRERVRDVQATLRQDGTTFILIASPGRSSMHEALYFGRKMRDYGLRHRHLLVNRVFDYPFSERPLPPLEALFSQTLGLGAARAGRLITACEKTHQRLADLARRDAEQLAALASALPDTMQLTSIPQLDLEPVELDAVGTLTDFLFGTIPGPGEEP